MDFVPPMLVVITCALVFGSIVRTWIVHRSLRANARAHVDLQTKLIERFGSADEAPPAAGCSRAPRPGPTARARACSTRSTSASCCSPAASG